MLSLDKLEEETNFCRAIYDAKKIQTHVSWDATKVTNGCWYITKAKACKKSEKKPEVIDDETVVNIFSSDDE